MKKEDDGWIYFPVKGGSPEDPVPRIYAGRWDIEESNMKGSRDDKDWYPITDIEAYRPNVNGFAMRVRFKRPFGRRRPSKG